MKKATEDSPLVMIEYSSPNTNKPLHLGHVRNNLLGWSLAQIMDANGNKVVKTNIVNDRGIHICKSMLAWLKWGNGETPESSGKKGDHLIGDYYVAFDKHYREEVKELVAQGMDEEKAKQEAPLIKEAHEMLVKWEQNDPEVRALWEKMNSWVYAGFDETYKKMGVSFDKIYYESQTISNLDMRRVECPLRCVTGDRPEIVCDAIRDIRFDNCHCNEAVRHVFKGGTGNPLERFVFTNCTLPTEQPVVFENCLDFSFNEKTFFLGKD